MSKEKIKENLSLHRLNKNLLWTSLLVTIGGSIGLFFTAITSNNSFIVNIMFTAFIILGMFLTIILFKLIQELNKKIFKLLDQLDKE